MAIGIRTIFWVALCAGFYLTLILAVQNGTIGTIQGIQNSGNLPQSEKPLRRFYTGISPIDNQLSSLIIFFWPIADAHLPTLTLFWVNFCGELAMSWTLIMIEGMRKGNKGSLISNIVIIGLVMQNGAYAVVMPFLWAIHPSTSSMASPSFSLLAPDVAEACSIPISVLMSFVFPLLLWGLPVPLVLTYDQKQIAMVLWQGFPFFSSIFQQISKRAFRAWFPVVSRNSLADQLCVLRGVYIFTLLLGTISHISALTMSFASLVYPTLFSSTCVHDLNPFKIFIPITASHHTEMASLAHGLLLLLQYDQIVGGISTLVWAFIMLRKFWAENHIEVHWIVSAFLMGFVTILTGPVGCAIVLIWIRDEIAFFRLSQKVNHTIAK